MRRITTEISGKCLNMALLCSFMVVVIHCVGVYCRPDVFAWYCLRDGICRLAVPTFFFMSGFFLSGKSETPNWWKTEVRKRYVSLLAPFVIWNTLFFLLQLIRARLDNNLSISVVGIASAYGLNPLTHPANGPLWYIRALFIIVAISPLVMWAVGNRKRAIISLVVVFVLYGIIGPWEGGDGMLQYFFRKTVALQGVFYFAVGASFRLGAINLIIKRDCAYSLLCVALILLIIKVSLQSHGILAYRYVGFFSVPLAVIGALNVISAKAFPVSVATLSFPIYVLHPFVVNVHLFVLNKLGMGMQSCPTFVALLMTLETFIVSGIVVLIIRRYMPSRVNVLLWGGR